MQEPLLPGFTVRQHGFLRNVWEDHVDSGLPVPSVAEPLATYEAEKMERDNAGLIIRADGQRNKLGVQQATIGKEIERRLGARIAPNWESMSPQAATQRRNSADFEIGIRAVIRLLATGKNFGSTDLQELVDGGPALPKFAEVFEGAVKDLMLTQQHLLTLPRERITCTPARTPRSRREPILPGFGLGGRG